MAVSIGTWATFTNGSDPSGTAIIDAGSGRKLILAVMGECDSNLLSITVTIGGVAPTETKSLDLELGSGGADISIRGFIWDESAIGSMTGSSISWADGITWSKISWSYVTVTGTAQSTTDSATDSNAAGTSLTITWPSTTTTDGGVVAFGVANSANREPISFTTGISSRQTYSLSDYAAAIGDGTGGGSVASSMTISNDGVSSGLGGIGIYFAPSDTSIAAYYNTLLQDF